VLANLAARRISVRDIYVAFGENIAYHDANDDARSFVSQTTSRSTQDGRAFRIGPRLRKSLSIGSEGRDDGARGGAEGIQPVLPVS